MLIVSAMAVSLVLVVYIVSDTSMNWDNIERPADFEGIGSYSKEDFYINFVDNIVSQKEENQDPTAKSGLLLGGDRTDFASTGDWYVDASSWAVGDARSVELANNNKVYEFTMYDGLPWAADADTYYVDLEQATRDLYEYVAQVSVGTEGITAYTLDRALTNNGRVCMGSGIGHSFNSTGADYSKWVLDGNVSYNYGEIDGVKVLGVGFPPIVVNRAFNREFSSLEDPWAVNPKLSAGWYHYGALKVAAKVKNKQTGEVLFLPCSPVDAKGHTFPGGVVQTNLAAEGYNPDSKEFTLAVAQTSGDAGGGRTKVSLGKLAELMNTVSPTGYAPAQYTYNVMETVGWPRDMANALGKNYIVEGYVVWGVI